MADDLDMEIYPHNDDTVSWRPQIVRENPTTGVRETITFTGRTDCIAFLSTDQDIHTATPIAGLQISLTEIGSTAVYTGVMEGLAKATALAATADNTILYRHYQLASDARRVKEVIWRKFRA